MNKVIACSVGDLIKQVYVCYRAREDGGERRESRAKKENR